MKKYKQVSKFQINSIVFARIHIDFRPIFCLQNERFVTLHIIRKHGKSNLLRKLTYHNHFNKIRNKTMVFAERNADQLRQ